jgi:hypothetical protein
MHRDWVKGGGMIKWESGGVISIADCKLKICSIRDEKRAPLVIENRKIAALTRFRLSFLAFGSCNPALDLLPYA